MKDVVVIGAGLTGLTVSFLLKRQRKDILVLEKKNRVGGVIHSHNEDGYIFEEGPNTGVVSNPEVAELFEMLDCELETANESAERRLILKNNHWHPLPVNPISFIRTPLFTMADKIRMFFEPFRKRGTEPEESVAALTARRIGKSFVDYAVNPFISGIYAGDPEHLVTKYALPKLYNLEQNYGSFIGGAIKKTREKKSEYEKKASKKVFSVKGGLKSLIDSLERSIEPDNISCNAQNIIINPKDNFYEVSYNVDGLEYKVETKQVVTAIGSLSLSSLLPFLSNEDLKILTDLNYAKVVQISVALKKNALNPKYTSFGGLIPQKEKRDLLGVLFPSYCFDNRAPENCAVLAVYMGGIKHPELYKLSDTETRDLIHRELNLLFGIEQSDILFMKIFRHKYAIPQYEKSSGDRFKTIQKLEAEYKGLIIAGNIRDGIGMADRIKQAFNIVRQLK